ncbi:hypothetical protein NL676_023844 [Syzygium grande]|nr:hypothetical protein NL676_023844 [Syzygium grande]
MGQKSDRYNHRAPHLAHPDPTAQPPWPGHCQPPRTSSSRSLARLAEPAAIIIVVTVVAAMLLAPGAFVSRVATSPSYCAYVDHCLLTRPRAGPCQAILALAPAVAEHSLARPCPLVGRVPCPPAEPPLPRPPFLAPLGFSLGQI